MSISQIALLVVFTAVIGGGMVVYFTMQPKTRVKREAECVAAATTLPLVNTTTGIGRTAVIAECD